ncbi:MAG: hypothetical protein ACRD8Z_06710 [Nitrososphaeraceae archaeon]
MVAGYYLFVSPLPPGEHKIQFKESAVQFLCDFPKRLTNVEYRINEKINKVQGGCFSKNGHLYLTSDDTEDIRGYSNLNGKFLGSCNVDYDKSDDEEMEGLALGHITYPDGVSSFVHVIILDNDDLSKDDVYFKHFTVPDPSVL